jgi:hypothetical protein
MSKQDFYHAVTFITKKNSLTCVKEFSTKIDSDYIQAKQINN